MPPRRQPPRAAAVAGGARAAGQLAGVPIPPQVLVPPVAVPAPQLAASIVPVIPAPLPIAAVQPPVVPILAPSIIRGVDQLESWNTTNSVSIKVWLDKLEALAELFNWSDTNKTTICKVKIGGKDATSYVSTLHDPNNPLSWTAFRTLLIGRFDIQLGNHQLFRLIGEVRQDRINNESITKYTARFNQIADEIDRKEMTETMKKSLYLAGITAVLSNRVKDNNTLSFSQLVNSVLTEEKALYAELKEDQQLRLHQQLQNSQRGRNNEYYGNKRKRDILSLIGQSPQSISSSTATLPPTSLPSTLGIQLSTPATPVVNSSLTGPGPSTRLSSTDGTTITCFNCEQVGHSATDCPTTRDTTRIARNFENFSRSKKGRFSRGGRGRDRGRGG